MRLAGVLLFVVACNGSRSHPSPVVSRDAGTTLSPVDANVAVVPADAKTELERAREAAHAHVPDYGFLKSKGAFKGTDRPLSDDAQRQLDDLQKGFEEERRALEQGSDDPPTQSEGLIGHGHP